MAPRSTIPAFLDHAAATWPQHPAIEDSDRSLSFAELAREVEAAARGLWGLSIEAGDRVAIWAPNCWQWIVAALAVHRVGAAVVPINTRYKGHEAATILERSGARALLTVRGFLGLDYPAMVPELAVPVVVIRGEAGASELSWDAFLAGGGDGEAEVHAEDVSDILFTSGTTGSPKGVPTTHEQSCRVYWQWSEVVGLQQADRYLVVAPFFHCFGYKAGWLAALMRGCTVLPQAVFDVDEVLARIGPDRVSVLPGPPALYQSLLQRDLSTHDLSSLRLAVTGAAVIPVRLIEAMREELGFDVVITGYGLTESSGVATMCRHDDPPETIAATSGRAIAGVEVAVVDADGNTLPAGEPGEVVVRGYNVMAGYLDDPEATAEAVVDGWLHTGDIGVLDERGYLRITDRLGDMFIVGGFNAYPAEIEQVLSQHPGVAEVAVVGMPHERLGEVARAFVVSTEDVDEAAIIAWAGERLANFKVPRRVERIEALPRNASGKVLKHQLRALSLAVPAG